MVLPIITSAPHDADSFGPFSSRVRLSPWQLGEFADKYTAVTAYNHSALGNLKSTISRGLGSLNQPRDLELFKEKDFHGNTIWKEGASLTEKEKEECFKTYYDPYHNEIERLIKRSRTLGFERVILWDQHDTGDFDELTQKRDRKLPGGDRTMPKFILSNFGLEETGEIDPKNGFTSCPPEFIQQVKDFISYEFDLPHLEIEINTIFKGGHIMQHYGNPKNDFGNTVVGIQIEYNRGFVIDQRTRLPYKEKLKEFNEKFNRVMEKTCGLL
jgi:N-formylglutamate amidohydrolase